MSGAEAIAVVAVIASITSIIDGTKQVYAAATNVRGLPEAFREVGGRLPIIRNILGSVEQYVDKGNVDEDLCKGVKHIVEACEQKAKRLDDLFHKAIAADGTSDLKRYYRAVKACGKGNQVESLMKGMLEDVQLLASEHGMKTATQAQQEQLIKAIRDVSAVLPSVPEHVFEGTRFTNKNYGSSTQHNAEGEYVAQGNARQYNTTGGAMYFGSMQDDSEDCLTALFLTDPRSDREQLIQAKGSRADGTCQWITSNDLYRSWLHARSQLLWLSGGPGKGKTMLSIFLAEELERTAKHSQDVIFLQYFCDNKDEKRKTAVAILRGLIFQLLRSRRKLFDHILPSFKIQKESLFTSSSFETLWSIFQSMVCDPALGTTYCVLDGLDECDKASIEKLLRKLATLLSGRTDEFSTSHLNLIVVSRDHPDFIPELLSSFPRIRLDPDADTEIYDDIHRFIEAKVGELSRHRHYPEVLRAHVKRVFRNRAHGTFLWVGIVAKALKKYKATEVELALDLFPSGLEEIYARMLLQIDVDRREIAAKILRWVVMAARPLTLSELSVVIGITGERSIVPFNRNEVTRDQVSSCGSFLTIREDEVGLIHQSAKDYLLRKTHDANPELEIFRVKEETANLEIARNCFNYLQSGALANREDDPLRDTEHLKAFPLLSYAAFHWHEHARFLSRLEDIFDLSNPFYHKKSQIRMSWIETYWSMAEHVDPPRSFTLLHIASYFGILPLAENLALQEGWTNKVKRLHCLNKTDGEGRTALMWAAGHGHEAVVRLLLEKGADAKARNRYSTALTRAAEKGHEAVVRLLLLRKGVDVKTRDGLGLMLAALYGHEAVVRLLLEKGADINVKNCWGMAALFYATREGHEAVVQLLLEKGADVNVKNRWGMTALINATCEGHEALVQLLLGNGADVNTKNNKGQTALIRAAQGGNKAVMQLLLEKGADIDAKDKCGQTALIEAAYDGNKAVVQLLLEKGVDIDAKDNNGKTALDTAASRRREVIVRLLLEKGAT